MDASIWAKGTAFGGSCRADTQTLPVGSSVNVKGHGWKLEAKLMKLAHEAAGTCVEVGACARLSQLLLEGADIEV